VERLASEEFLSLAVLYTYAEQYQDAERALRAYLASANARDRLRARKDLLSILIAVQKFDEAAVVADQLLDEPTYDHDLITRVQLLITKIGGPHPKAAGVLAEKMMPGLFDYVGHTKEIHPISIASLLQSAYEEGLTIADAGSPERAKAYFQSFLTRFNSSPVSSNKDVRQIMDYAIMRMNLVGSAAPAIQAIEFIGAPKISLKDLRGKVILLDFMAHWCPQCIEDLPYTNSLRKKYMNEGLVVLGITEFYGYFGSREGLSQEDELMELKEFKTKHKIEFGIIVCQSNNHQNYGVSGYPAAALIDRAGRIRFLKQGADYKQDIAEKIEKLLAEPSIKR
jgi:thiol-disulfide isomerase/thioredoxin